MSRTVARSERFPPVDERLVMPGSGAEIVQGRVLIVPGADPPHAQRHLNLAYLLGAHTAPGFVAAIDMLTRTGPTSDFAPDASVFPEGPDPETGGRRLEVLAFEVVSEQRLSVPARKARELARRGVERVVALVLAKNRALEWDRVGDRWRPMHLDETIAEPCLVPALPVRALLEVARADEAVLAALEARRPDLVARIEARGEARGHADAIRETCAALGIPITAPRARILERATLDELRAISAALARDRRWPTPRRR